MEFDARYYQEICFKRKPDIYFKVFSGKRLILSTEDSVLWTVDQWPRQVAISVGLLPGKVDGPTPPSVLSVRGRVAKADGSPLAELQVVALDRDGRSQENGGERFLGETYTDPRGYYAIRYTVDQLVSPAKGSADLVVRVYEEQSTEPLAASPLILNALEEEIINLSVGEEAYRGRSEHQAVTERLKPLLEGIEEGDFSRQDVAYFSNQTDLTVEQVQLYVEAGKQSRKAGLDAGVLYGLYRSGLPYSFAALTVQSPEVLGASLKRAQEMNIIAPLDETSVAKTIESLQALGVQELLDSQAPARVHAAELLDLVDLSASEKSAVLKVYSASPEPSNKFWGNLQQAGVLDEAKFSLLHRTFELNALSLDHLPLVEKLKAHIGDGSLKELAVKDPEEWSDFLQAQGVGTPKQIPGDTAEEKRSNYSLILARIMEDSYPTTAVAGRWIKDPTLDREVAAFFGTNPDFSFESWGINDYLKKYPGALDGVEDKKSATFKLQAAQNLHRIAPRFERLRTVKTLWQDKLYSAHVIKRMGEEKFVEKYEKAIGAPQARLVYANAEKVAGFALLALAKYAWDTNGITPYAIPKTDLAVNPNETTRPTLEELFVNLDFCHCKHCRSVLGPAAYLVDLLMFLNDAAAKDGDTGLEKLFARRPDLGNIELSCENANTVLPYIDLVNEALEDTVVPRTYQQETHEGTTVYVAEVYQTEEKRKESLRAHPEHLNQKAYDELNKSTTAYPWVLPFSLWMEEARRYLTQLGVKRHELMEVFKADETEVLVEALGLIPAERTLLTAPAINDETALKAIWGVKTGSLIKGLEKASAFLRHAGIDYPQLESLLQCRFINSSPGASGAMQISFDKDNPCSLGHAKMTNLASSPGDLSRLDKLHRFIRLHRKLGWRFFDLDKVLTAFAKTTIDDDLLGKLSLTVQLQNRLGVDLLTALSWWSARLDTAEYKDTPSQYSELFLSGTVGDLRKGVHDTLKLNSAGDELSATNKKMTDADYEPVILSATQLTKDDLALIIKKDLGDDTLNLKHLSHVFRVASFSRALGLSVNEYYILKKLSGIVPLSSPSPGGSAAPKETKAFLEAKEAVTESGISLAELVYLLAHDTSQPNNGRLADQGFVQRLTDVRANLALIRAAHQMPSEGLQSVLAERLGDVLEGEEERNVALQIILNQSSLKEAEQKTFIDKHFNSFLDTTDAKKKLVAPGSALITDIPTRISYVLGPLLAYLLLRESRRYLQQGLSESLSVSVAAASVLLDTIKNPADTNQTAEDVFLAEPLVTGIGEIKTDSPQFKVYERIFKASRLLAALKTNPADQAFIIKRGPAVGWPDVNALPLAALSGGAVLQELFERFTEMVKAYQIGPRILTSGATLAEFLEEIAAPALSADEIKERLETNTAWALDDIQTLTTKYGFALADLRKSAWLVQLHKAFSILKRLGVRATQAWAWNAAEVSFDQAVQIKLAVKSKYDSKEWLDVAPTLREPLRERQRDALLAYVIELLRERFPTKDIRGADEVYAYLLIDPQMNACMDTSRIKQAIASVQLFVQRILMNLEKDEIELTYADAKQWKWRKNYRVWEANRKVFLWPENWTYPDLRDDKSPFFKELEDELYQSDLDDDSAERALISYLKKLDEVANLEVSGLYEDNDTDTGRHVLHVIARTQSTPHKYFYRRRVNERYWTAWEPVEADIEGDHLLPVVHNRRLFLFWPKFTEKAEEPSGSKMAVPTDKKRYSRRTP